MKNKVKSFLLLGGICLGGLVSAAVTVDESKGAITPPLATHSTQSRTIDVTTAEMPRGEKRPLGTAIGGANSTTPITRQGDTALSMKCWQEGKLIIDQPVKSPPADAQKGSTMTNPTTGSVVYAFDFKNAMCLVK